MHTRHPLIRSRGLPSTAVASCLALLAACASVPIPNGALEQARTRLNAAQAQPTTVALAVDELARARESLRRADAAWVNGETAGEVNHLSYMTLQEVVLAEETAASRDAQSVAARAGAERDRLRLELRTRNAETAQAQKPTAEQVPTVKPKAMR